MDGETRRDGGYATPTHFLIGEKFSPILPHSIRSHGYSPQLPYLILPKKENKYRAEAGNIEKTLKTNLSVC